MVWIELLRYNWSYVIAQAGYNKYGLTVSHLVYWNEENSYGSLVQSSVGAS